MIKYIYIIIVPVYIDTHVRTGICVFHSYLPLYMCDIWPSIGIMDVWLPTVWCGIDGVYE